MAVQRFVESDTSALPFLHAALIRLLEEYPATTNGLGRLHRQLLELLNESERSPVELFRQNAAREEAMFLGDGVYWLHVEALASARVPLLELALNRHMNDRLPDGVVRITTAGRDVVAGKRDAIELNGIDRWLGGVHLRDHSGPRWDTQQLRLTSR